MLINYYSLSCLGIVLHYLNLLPEVINSYDKFSRIYHCLIQCRKHIECIYLFDFGTSYVTVHQSLIDNQVWLNALDPLFLVEWSFSAFMMKGWKRRNPNSQRLLLLPLISMKLTHSSKSCGNNFAIMKISWKPVALTLQNHRLRMAQKSGLSEKSSKLWWPQSERS